MNGITGYTIYFSDTGNIYHDVPYRFDSPTTFNMGFDLPSNSYHCFDIASRNENGDFSQRVGPACSWTIDVNDNTPPTIPSNLSVTRYDENHLLIGFNSSEDNNTPQYMIKYRFFINGHPQAWTGYRETLTGINGVFDSSTRWCIAVSAVDRMGNESAPSPEVCVGTGSSGEFELLPEAEAHFNVYGYRGIPYTNFSNGPPPFEEFELIYNAKQSVDVDIQIGEFTMVWMETNFNYYYAPRPFGYDYIALNHGSVSINNWYSSNIEGGPSGFMQAVSFKDSQVAYGKLLVFSTRNASVLSIKTLSTGTLD